MERKRLTIHTKLTNYMPIPRSVLSLNVSPLAVIIYGMLLDRSTLSQKYGYSDAGGWIYVVYPQMELAHDLSVSTRIIGKHIAALESAGLIKRVRQSPRGANQYYLFLPSDAVTGTPSGTFLPPHRKKTVSQTGKEVPPNNRKEQQDIINCYQHGEEESL